MPNWEPVIGHPEYEIFDEHPHQLRRVSNGHIVSFRHNPQGYLVVNLLTQHALPHHRIVARQWIPNPDNKLCIDHKNSVRDDNHISNLRWATHTENNTHISTSRGVAYTLLDEIPEDAIHVEEYDGFTFNDLYFHDNVFYKFDGIKYRVMKVFGTNNPNGYRCVNMKDINRVNRAISLAKFKREYNLID
jgi:hypothetical protein